MILADQLFKVAVLTDYPGSDLHNHVVVSAEGDCWMVARYLPWSIREEVRVPTMLMPLPLAGKEEWVPRWHEVGGQRAYRYVIEEPAEVIRSLWGDEAAHRYIAVLDAAAVEPMEPIVLPEVVARTLENAKTR